MPFSDIQTILDADLSPDQRFDTLLPRLGEDLDCDRIFLYIRHPDRRLGRSSHCWRKHDNLPEIYNDTWELENPAHLEAQDPLFAAALRAEPSIFVEDVETAPATVLNRDYEHRHFGHQALIHAHLLLDKKPWGILQPCIFQRPRIWTKADRSIIQTVITALAPTVKAYVEATCPKGNLSPDNSIATD